MPYRPLVVVAAAACFVLQAAFLPAQERKVPKDSVELVVHGCLKGRVLTILPPQEVHGPVRGPNLEGRNFRLAGRKDIMQAVKRYDRQLVEVAGLVRQNDVTPVEPGFTAGRTRVIIGAPSQAGTAGRPPMGPGVAVMDATSVRLLSERCPIPMR